MRVDSLEVEFCLRPLMAYFVEWCSSHQDSQIIMSWDPPRSQGRLLMRKYIWSNVHITVEAGLESGREGYHGDMQGSRGARLTWTHVRACFVKILYVCWLFQQCGEWEIWGVFRFFFSLCLPWAWLCKWQRFAFCFWDCILSVLVILKLGSTGFQFYVSHV